MPKSRLLGAVGSIITTLLVGLSPLTSLSARQAPQASTYFPTADDWHTSKPSDVGMDDAVLAQAVEWAKQHDSTGPRDFSAQASDGQDIGPLPPDRAGVNGIIIRHGYIVAEFGDTAHVDPTYSIAKSYLSTLLGLAIDRSLIKNITDPVRAYVDDGGYDSPHNAKITWEDHARQTSEWDGVMFGKDAATSGEGTSAAASPRTLSEPGTFYEYNDARVNRFSLSLLRVWKRPLPDVLKTEILDPIGASATWRYLGYDNSDVEVDGRTMKSVPGGTRWGGGLWMSTRDLARFGYLMLRRGNWNGRQLISASWIEQATKLGGGAPGSRPDYGYLWWLNDGAQWPDAPKSSFAAIGNGPNILWIDPEHDLVAVWRWYAGRENEFFNRVLAAIEPARLSRVTTAERPPTARDGSVPLMAGFDVRPPANTSRIWPVIPAGATAQGMAILQVVISATGAVDEVTVLRGVLPSQPALDDAAVEAVKRWEYAPTIVDGVPRAVWMDVVINYYNASSWK